VSVFRRRFLAIMARSRHYWRVNEYLLVTRFWFVLVASHIEIIMGWNPRLASRRKLAFDPVTSKPYAIPMMNTHTDPRRVAPACRSRFRGWTPEPVKSGIITLR